MNQVCRCLCLPSMLPLSASPGASCSSSRPVLASLKGSLSGSFLASPLSNQSTMTQVPQGTLDQSPPATSAVPHVQSTSDVPQCKFWLPKKSRCCANKAKPGHEYCGNHSLTPEEGRERIPCPLDPSHTVFRDDLASHLSRCPTAKQRSLLESQPFMQPEINAGSVPPQHRANLDGINSLLLEDALSRTDGKDRAVDPPRESLDSFAEKTIKSRASRVREHVLSMDSEQWQELVDKIEGAFSSATLADVACPEESVVWPEECQEWVEQVSQLRDKPLELKHVRQQASILGNMVKRGIIQPVKAKEATPGVEPANQAGIAPEPEQKSDVEGEGKGEGEGAGGERGGAEEKEVFVELGAGRGYLTQLLCDCFGVRDVILVERRSYKLKADRSLRKLPGMRLERVRVDISDLDLRGLKHLTGRRFVTISKHLCGVATDLALRCCERSINGQDHAMKSEAGAQRECPAGVAGKDQGTFPVCRGIAIATCCHHLTTWQAYINRPFFESLGFSQKDFEATVWMSSWALLDPSEDEKKHGEEHDDKGYFPRDIPKVDVPSENQHTGGKNECLGDLPVIRLTVPEKSKLGRRCKALVDAGRVFWLRSKGWECAYVQFINNSISPENKLILGCPPQQS